MAFTKERKADIVSQYTQWMAKSQAVFILEYSKMNMKAVDAARAKVREAGGELHIVKNTLFKLVLENGGMAQPKGVFEGSTLVGFAFNDAPMMAKIIADITKNSEVFKVKGGYLGKQAMNQAQIKNLADLPPISVLRARLLGVLLAPAGRLVRTLAEPARSLAGVFKAYSEKEAAPAA